MKLNSIPAFQDNYIWLLDNQQGHCIIVDPGEAAPVLGYLAQQQLQPDAILLTHHHHDHTGGVAEIVAQYPNLIVIGPQETAEKGNTRTVIAGEKVEILGLSFDVLATPGHTLGHVSYYSAPYLFCGDTLFSAGCGRLFEGTAEQMFESFQQIAALPDETLVCCAHEYTLSNLKFAHSILPENQQIKSYLESVTALRSKGLFSLPTKLHLERQINLFLRCDDVDLQRKLDFNTPPSSLHHIFAELRLRKDLF